jgi:hypothetical protein
MFFKKMQLLHNETKLESLHFILKSVIIYLMNNRHGRLDVFKHNGTDVEARLAEIIERKLDARNIDTYADQALDDLIELVEFVVAKYDYQSYCCSCRND